MKLLEFYQHTAPLERKNGSQVVGFHWDLYRPKISIVLLVQSLDLFAHLIGFRA